MLRKITALILVFLTTGTLLTASVNAQDATVTPSPSPFNKKLEREAMNQKFQQKREEMKDMFQQKRQEFKEKVSTFKNLRKKAGVENIQEKITKINANRTTQMEEALAKFDERLTKIKEQVPQATESGIDAAPLNSAIASAEAALTKAEEAVAAQKVKEYAITLTTEEMAKVNVGQTIRLLQTDLRTTHKTVVDARQAVINARKELAKITNGKNPTVDL